MALTRETFEKEVKEIYSDAEIAFGVKFGYVGYFTIKYGCNLIYQEFVGNDMMLNSFDKIHKQLVLNAIP